MPKRDVAYMQNQREMIAQAALECMIENGVPGTSLRDICARAGVSIGALYIHFQSKNDVILAACSIENEFYKSESVPETWTKFEIEIVNLFAFWRTPRQLRRFRLSLQFVAELAVEETAPSGMPEHYQFRLSSLRVILARLRENGEITLPLGLEATTATLLSLLVGNNYMALGNHGAKRIECPADLLPTMALIVGRKAGR